MAFDDLASIILNEGAAAGILGKAQQGSREAKALGRCLDAMADQIDVQPLALLQQGGNHPVDFPQQRIGEAFGL